MGNHREPTAYTPGLAHCRLENHSSACFLRWLYVTRHNLAHCTRAQGGEVIVKDTKVFFASVLLASIYVQFCTPQWPHGGV
jgi:hypothetical protein